MPKKGNYLPLQAIGTTKNLWNFLYIPTINNLRFGIKQNEVVENKFRKVDSCAIITLNLRPKNVGCFTGVWLCIKSFHINDNSGIAKLKQK